MIKNIFLKRNQMRLGVLTFVWLALVQVPGAFCDWDRNAASFKVYSGISAAITRENMRINVNGVGTNLSGGGGAGGFGSADSQGQSVSNMNNVVQITENNEIVLNGNENSVFTNGTVLNSDQGSTASEQNGGNDISE